MVTGINRNETAEALVNASVGGVICTVMGMDGWVSECGYFGLS